MAKPKAIDRLDSAEIVHELKHYEDSIYKTKDLINRAAEVIENLESYIESTVYGEDW